MLVGATTKKTQMVFRRGVTGGQSFELAHQLAFSGCWRQVQGALEAGAGRNPDEQLREGVDPNPFSYNFV